MTTNPALADLQFLAGAWDMELSEASFLPDPAATVGGSVTFEWIEQGAALVMRMGDTAAWIIGRDEAEPDYRVLYADGRGVSRVYGMSFSSGTWRMWRDTPEFLSGSTPRSVPVRRRSTAPGRNQSMAAPPGSTTSRSVTAGSRDSGLR